MQAIYDTQKEKKKIANNQAVFLLPFLIYWFQTRCVQYSILIRKKMAVEFLLLRPLRSKSSNPRHLMCTMNNNTYEDIKSLLSLFMEFFYHVDTFMERSWEIQRGRGEKAIKITNTVK